jgi:hypothetical protein
LSELVEFSANASGVTEDSTAEAHSWLSCRSSSPRPNSRGPDETSATGVGQHTFRESFRMTMVPRSDNGANRVVGR